MHKCCILGVPSSATTPDTIHLSAQPHHSMLVLVLILLGLAGNDLFQQTWKVIHFTRTCGSCLSISLGLPNYQFHQTQDKFKKLGKYSFAQIRSCGLASACHQLPATAFWGKDSKHQRSSSSWSILLGLAGKRGQGSHFFEDSQMQSIEHVGTLEFQCHLSKP